MHSREDVESPGSVKARAQLDRAERSDLPQWRGGPHGQRRIIRYRLFQRGSTQIQTQSATKQWCAPGSRKRPVDLVLLSLGGNDVGFSALAAYALTENAGDLAPIVQWIGSQIRFGPNVSRAYLDVLDERFKALKDALRDGFGVDPARGVHTSYEPIQFDETGRFAARNPTRHGRASEAQVEPGAIDRDRGFPERVSRAARMHYRCAPPPDCPANLATGAGTGFKLVTEHQAKFARRGLCARDPQRAAADGADGHAAQVAGHRRVQPFSPAAMLPYALALAAVPHAERRLPDRQHAPRRHFAVRHPAAGLCRALFGSDPSQRGSACHCCR